MMTSEIESKISRVINKLENAQINAIYRPTTNETQEGNYRIQKRIAGVITQANINNISSFDFQNDSNQIPINDSCNDISNSFSEHPSEILDQPLPVPSLKRRASVILDLNKIINVGEYKIELGKLLNILDKKLPDNKENNLNNEASKTYTQCTTEENEPKKSFASPEKKTEKNKISNEKSFSSEKSDEKLSQENSKNCFDTVDNLAENKKFQENLSKKYHKIYLLLKSYMNENKLFNELNKKGLKENNGIIGNLNITINDTNNMNCRRKSLFDTTSYLIPSEGSIKSFSKNNQLPNLISNFFDQKKLGKRKKRNTCVGGKIKNKLKKLNQQMENKSTTKAIPQSEKAEFKIKPKRSSITGESNNKISNNISKKDISQISDFDTSNNNENESIIDNDNSVFCGNDNKGGSFLFNDGLSAVKKRRQSDFFDNFQPQQQDEISGFHKMISTIIEEEDNFNINNIANNNGNNNIEKNEDKKDSKNNDAKEDKEDKKNNSINVGNEKNEEESEKAEYENSRDNEYEDEEDVEDEEDDDTLVNDDYCYVGNINSSLCFDELINI